MRLLLDAGVKIEPSDDATSALAEASGQGHLQVVQLLLAAGAAALLPF